MRFGRLILATSLVAAVGSCKREPASTGGGGRDTDQSAPRFYDDPNHPTRAELERHAAWNNDHSVPEEITGWALAKCGNWVVKEGASGPYLGFAPLTAMPADCHTTIDSLGRKTDHPAEKEKKK
jgi:hypothetical protein